jgi:hypothetical protein
MSSENSEKELPIEMLVEFVKRSQSDVEVENRNHLYVPGEADKLNEYAAGELSVLAVLHCTYSPIPHGKWI